MLRNLVAVVDPRRAELEAELAASWTRENLAVYADYLQTIEDPRGEWIAFELSLVRDGITGAGQARLAELTQQFQRDHHRSMAYGFVQELVLDSVEAITTFDRTPIAPYLRGVFITAYKPAEQRAIVRAFARVQRSWLRRLKIHVASDDVPDLEKVLGSALTEQLVAATPQLETFVVSGGSHVTFAHPALRQPTFWGLKQRPHPKVALAIADEPADVLDLGRMSRLHGGIVADLESGHRDAWAELRFAIEQLEVYESGAPAYPLAATTLQAVIASIDLTWYHGQDWAPTAEKLSRHAGLRHVYLSGA
ncbi:MAG: hypothetical protein ABI867_21520 [Kofleriaceae bacterium]